MIEFSFKAKDGTVFVHRPVNQKEEVELRTLLSQTKVICELVGEKGKTGLWIVKEFSVNGRICAILSLGRKINIIEKELSGIVTMVEDSARKKGER